MKPVESVPQERYTVEALARGLELLTLFSAETPTLSQTEIVAASGLNKSTAFRMLATLESLGYVERDPATRRYRPGLKVLRLGFTALNTLDVRQVARPYLEALAHQVNETASLAMLDGRDIVYIDRVRNQSIVGVVLGVGSRLAAHCTALGKSLLSALPDDALDDWLAEAPLAPLTPQTLVDPAALRTELLEIRRQGYALSDQELAIGLRAVAAPIRDSSQKAVAAINVTGPTATISRERLIAELMPAVVHTAGQISLALGYSPLKQPHSRTDTP